MALPLRRRAPSFLLHDPKLLFFSLSLLLPLLFASETEKKVVAEEELFLDVLRDEAASRIYQLGKVSDADNYLERTFLSPASMKAGDLILSWMEDAGLKTWTDDMGNIHGRVESQNATAEALLIGSHLDTVIDAGMYDGALGIICAISALKAMKVCGKLDKLCRPVEVIAFSDEEGVRFQTTFLGSAAISGILPPSVLKIADKSGVTVEDALHRSSFRATEASLAKIKYDPTSVFGYVEVHIEQGPVLESLNYPLGVVKGIAGQTRLMVTVGGSQGHAGTVPMFMRRDPMVAASELIVFLESLCKHPQKFLTSDDQCVGIPTESFTGLVCTVGEISCWPSASNVIPGQVQFTVDIRAVDDMTKEAVVRKFSDRVDKICQNRKVKCAIDRNHNAVAARSNKDLSLLLQQAVHSAMSRIPGSIQEDVPVLMSGAGHDAMAMSHLTKMGMIFVRCRGGLSHSPDEHVSEDDVWAAGLALLQFLNEVVRELGSLRVGHQLLCARLLLSKPAWQVAVSRRSLCRKRRRETEECSGGSNAYLAFVAEGLRELQDWHKVMNYQRKNGSLFNSPATTAAALTQVQDDKALNYLSSLLQKFGSSVPTTYPLDLRAHLSMVNRLERLGISHHFVHEIRGVLDRTYRCWLNNDEEIFSDIATCAMAFRILRMHGYDVSSDSLSQFGDATQFKNIIQGHFKDFDAAIELFKASQTQVSAEEPVLEKLNSWATLFLKEEVNGNSIHSLAIFQEVDYTLRFPFYANLERLEHKRNIEHYNLESFQMLKTSYRSFSSIDRSILELAVDEFSSSQLIYRNELHYLESWVKESKLDQLEFSRQKQTYCYLSAAATLFSAELSDARICWAKGGVLTTVVDDFFDGGGSIEEQANLIMLVERWHGNHKKDFYSENVKIIFFALYNTINDLGTKAYAFQKRDLTGHISNIWLHMMKSMKKEAKWLNNNIVPTIDEYMMHAIPSFALGPIILPSLYFVGPEVSEDVIESPEYLNLFKLVSRLGRLLNDMQGFERDQKDGKMNSISLLVHHGNGSISEEDARGETMSMIESTRAELLGLVLQEKGSKVPKSCKELFWKMSKILHLFYKNTDGFTSPKEMIGAVNAVIHEPLKVSHLLLSND